MLTVVPRRRGPQELIGRCGLTGAEADGTVLTVEAIGLWQSSRSRRSFGAPR